MAATRATNEAMTLEKTEQLFDFLTGGSPPGEIRLNARPPRMSTHQAFSVIYVLQEVFHVIPERFEQCFFCRWIFDSHSEGHAAATGRFYCDNCSRHCKCLDCKQFRARH